MNQLGFLPVGAKRAVVPTPATAPLPWRVTDSSGAVLASGQARVFGDDPASGQHVQIVDFGGVERPGQGYRLTVGEAQSRPFAISARLYARLKDDALNFFYQQRSGVA